MSPATESLFEPATRRARLLVAYNGKPFHGYASNDGVDTVAGSLMTALQTVTRSQVSLVAAGRTDAGVHARGQVVSCDLPSDTDLGRLTISLNALCGPHISVRSIAWVNDSFNARFSATWRHYRYVVLNTPTPDPFLADTAWHIREPLQLYAMQLACDALIGEHDFTSFCKKPQEVPGQPTPSMKRYVMRARWSEAGEGILHFEVRANAFCHNMVRSIVGLLVDVGLGKRPPSDVRAVLVARDRTTNSPMAPAHGLTLWEVGYENAEI